MREEKKRELRGGGGQKNRENSKREYRGRFFSKKENREGYFYQYQFAYYSSVFETKYEKVLI